MELSPQQVCQEILQLLDCVKVSILALAETQGLTQVQLIALYFIDQRGDLAMGQVADVLHCDASNVTGIVDRMVVQGLVVRQESTKDRRTKKLQLTAKGKQVVAALHAALPGKLHCDSLSATERTTLHTIVQKVCGA